MGPRIREDTEGERASGEKRGERLFPIARRF